MKPVTVLSATYGLYNTLETPHRAPSKEGNVIPFAQSLNVVCDDSGRPRAMDGYDRLHTGSCHSIKSFGDYALLVRAGYLSRMDSGRNINQIVALTNTTSEMSYAKVDTGQGRHDVYFSNGTDYGMVRNGAFATWGQTPNLSDPNGRRSLSGPFPGSFLEWWKGRMLISSGAILYASEPYSPGLYDLAGSRFHFAGEIAGFAGVTSGLWVMDATGVWWIAGGFGSQTQLAQKVLKMSGAGIKGAFASVDVDHFGVDYGGMGAVFATQAGVVLCGEDGFIRDLTGSRIKYFYDGVRIPVSSGSIFFNDKSTYVLMR